MDNSTKRRKMVQLQDELRAFVEKMSDDRLKCKFCGQLFSATTSITRLKWHWSQVEGRGVKTCDKVTTDVREAAIQLIQQASNKKRKTMLSSRNMNEVILKIPTTQEPGEERASSCAGAAGNPMENIIGGMTQPIDTSFSPDRLIVDANGPRGDAQQQNYEIDNLAGDEGRIQKEVQGTEQVVGEGRTTSCTHETRGDVRQVIEMLSQVALEIPEGGEALSQQEEALSPGGLAWMASMTSIDLRMEYTSPKELTLDAPETRPRTEPMHQDCEATSSDFLSLRTEDNVLENPAMGLMQGSERPSSPERLLINQLELQEDSSLNNDAIMNYVEDMIREPGQYVARGISHERPPVNQDEPRGDSSQPNDPLCLTHGRSYAQLCTPSANNDVIMNEVENMVTVPGQPVMRDSSREGLQHNGDESQGDAFPTTKLVGGECAKNKKAIWSLLMNDEVSIIGIYGMGGVGKTTLVKHIYNQLLERPGTSHHVYWVTVPRDFSIYRLQNFIAKCLHLDLSNEDEELRRAVRLSKEIKKNEKWVLILDDLWNSFELDKVGIPVPVKGCKLILTTRSLQVCRGMTCKHKIQVRVLPEEEAWILFMEKLTHDVILSSEVEKIAKSVTRECAGLPLGIITMARSMRGVDDLHEWRNTLEKLKQSKFREMEDEVFGVLKHSYDLLNDFALQQCLLYCALFPEDYEIRREDLIVGGIGHL